MYVEGFQALRLLDPSGLFFASRVFSRGDSLGGLKRIRRIFPTERKLALAIDDSEYMWEDTAKCIKVEGYFFFQDRTAGDLRRLCPENVSQWLATARPYCNFLPSGLSSHPPSCSFFSLLVGFGRERSRTNTHQRHQQRHLLL